MKKTIIYMVVSLLMGTLTACTSKQSDKSAERYHINFSETSPVQKENKSVLIISGSPRKGGNTDLLCDAFARGAEEAGGQVEKIFLADYRIDYFSEADEQRVGNRANEAEDDVPMLVDKMVRADVIVLASPVYYMNITGQLKTFIDRTFGRYREMKDKEFFYLTACADPEESTADWAINAFRGFVICLPNPTERGMVKAVGMGRKGAVKGSQFEEEAYNLGKNI
ncbi:MAG: flavodoxin family protein [Bacteroides sp.]